MAQTKRKRRTKHRGNAAGMVEVRGRTSKSAAGAPAKNGNGRGTTQARGPRGVPLRPQPSNRVPRHGGENMTQRPLRQLVTWPDRPGWRR